MHPNYVRRPRELHNSRQRDTRNDLVKLVYIGCKRVASAKTEAFGGKECGEARSGRVVRKITQERSFVWYGPVHSEGATDGEICGARWAGVRLGVLCRHD